MSKDKLMWTCSMENPWKIISKIDTHRSRARLEDCRKICA